MYSVCQDGLVGVNGLVVEYAQPYHRKIGCLQAQGYTSLFARLSTLGIFISDVRRKEQMQWLSFVEILTSN